MKSTRMRAALAASLAIGLLAGACGDDDDTASDDTTETTEAPDETTETTAAGEDEGGSLELTLTDEGLEGIPESVPAGAVEVTLTVEGSREYASLDFARVEDGTTVEQFAEGIAPVFEGGAFPEFFLNNSGLPETEPGTPTTATILLEPGQHIVWFEGIPESEDAPPPVSGELLEVTEGEAGELPDGDGEITARDYDFDVDVSGSGTIVFRNDGPDQLHHAVLVDFGTNTPEVVEEAIGPLVQGGEDDPPPAIEGFDMEQVNFDLGGSGVFGPGLGGTFEAEVQEGNTYAVVCFISDRAGGPPHAVGMEMYEVFTVGA
jgi:hypothetical protein